MNAYSKFLLFAFVFLTSIASIAQTKALFAGDMNPPHSPTVIKLGVYLEEVEKIDPVSNDSPKIHATFKLVQKWKDERLAFGVKNEGQKKVFNDEEAKTHLNKIFNPGINSVSGNMKIQNQHLTIFANGSVNLKQHVRITKTTHMNLLRFPLDTQHFKFRFASDFWSEKDVQIEAISSAEDINLSDEPPSWHLKYASIHVTNVVSHKKNYPAFQVTIHASRDPSFFIWHLLLPLLVIVFLSWNTFWVHSYDVQSLENCLIFLLTVVAYHQIISDLLPIISYFTYFDALIYISYLFTVIPTVQFLTGAYLDYSNRSQTAMAIRDNCKWIIPLAFCLLLFTTTLNYFSNI